MDIRRWVIIALRFPDYIVFLETLFFTCILFLCLLSKRNEWLSLNGNLRHAIQNHWMSSNSVACSQRWRLCFVLFCLELFLARPSWFLIQGKNWEVEQPLLESWQLLQSRALHMPLQLLHGKFPLTSIFGIWSIDGFDWRSRSGNATVFLWWLSDTISRFIKMSFPLYWKFYGTC